MTNNKLRHHPADPRGLIYEAYQMKPLKEEEYRSIFLDWALGTPIEHEMVELIKQLLSCYQDEYPKHPMTFVLREGLMTKSSISKRRRTRGRRKES